MVSSENKKNLERLLLTMGSSTYTSRNSRLNGTLLDESPFLGTVHFELIFRSPSQSAFWHAKFQLLIQGLGSQFGLVKQLFHSSVPGTLHRSIKIEIDSDNHCRSFLN